jgi:hypothetical protein
MTHPPAYGQVSGSTALAPEIRACEAQAQDALRQHFPSERFVVGFGAVDRVREIADGQLRSQQAAMAQVSKQLETKVDYEFEMFSAQNVAGRATQSARLVNRESSSLVLKNVHFEHECYDAVKHEYRIWAVLDRAAAIQFARASLAEINERGLRMQAEVQIALSDGKVREAVQAVAGMRALLAESSQHLQVLRALGSASESAFLDPVQFGTLERQALGKALIRVIIDDPQWMVAKSETEAELTRRDLPVCMPASCKGVAFEVRSVITPLSVAYSPLVGGTIVELQANVTVSYAHGSESIASFQIRERAAGRAEADATLNATKRLAKKMAPIIGDALAQQLGLDGSP